MSTSLHHHIISRLALSRSSQCCRRPLPTASHFLHRPFSQSSPLAVKKLNRTAVKTPSHAPNAAKPKSPPKTPSRPNALTQATPPASTPTTQNYMSHAAKLASKSTPTLLYESPFPLVHTTVCYAFGGFCIAYGAWNVYAQLIHPLHDLGVVATSFSAAMSLALGVIGVWSVSGTYRMVHTITALPGPASSALRLNVTSHPFLTLLKPRPQTAPCTAISTSAPLHKPQMSVMPLTRSQRVADQMERERIWQKERERLMTLPFRQMKYHLKNGFRALLGLYSREDTVFVRIEGFHGSWKLRKGLGYSLEDGKAWDRLVKVNVVDPN